MKLRGYIMPRVAVISPHKFQTLEPHTYHSPRYNRDATIPSGFVSDGATGAMDLYTRAWLVHDFLCTQPCRWDDGTECTRWQSSMVLHDCLAEDGFDVRAWPWALATWIAGAL